MPDLQTLDDIARQQRLSADVKAALDIARAAFVMGKDPHRDPAGAGTYAFFASLVLRCPMVEDFTLDPPTLATDGKVIRYHPAYLAPLDRHQLISELAHETSHNALQHPARLMELLGAHFTPDQLKRAQVAADCAVDPMNRDAGFWNPPGAIFPDQFGLPEGLTLEEYYRKLPDDAGQTHGKQAQHGGVQPATGPDGKPDPAAAAAQAAEWAVAVMQARKAAKMRGQLPAALDELCDAVSKHAVDWRLVLREFLSHFAKEDYSWTRPNRRHVADGIYLPSCHSEHVGRLVVMLDTSGSMSDEDCARNMGEVLAVLSERPMALDVLLHDSRLYATHSLDILAGDEMPPIKTRRGGTSHKPAFAWLEEHAPDAVAVLVFSDCESDLDYIEPPTCPALFFIPPNSGTAPSWAAGSAVLP